MNPYVYRPNLTHSAPNKEAKMSKVEMDAIALAASLTPTPYEKEETRRNLYLWNRAFQTVALPALVLTYFGCVIVLLILVALWVDDLSLFWSTFWSAFGLAGIQALFGVIMFLGSLAATAHYKQKLRIYRDSYYERLKRKLRDEAECRKIKVRLADGRTGTIDKDDFDPDTMVKL